MEASLKHMCAAHCLLPISICNDVRLMNLYVYSKPDGSDQILVLQNKMNSQPDKAPLVRIHSACFTGDVLGSARCDCGKQLSSALEMISSSEGGTILYLTHHEGRGIGLINKVIAYALQDHGSDTVDANVALGLSPDAREYSGASNVLHSMGLRSIRLITNNPAKIRAVTQAGIEVTERVPIVPTLDNWNRSYLESKRQRLGHLF